MSYQEIISHYATAQEQIQLNTTTFYEIINYIENNLDIIRSKSPEYKSEIRDEMKEVKDYLIGIGNIEELITYYKSLVSK